jgi:predicted DNA-binding transcriptional regulator AlpA
MTVEDIEFDLRIGRTKFYDWMARGWMPQPWIKDGGVSRWLTSELEEAVARFPDRAALGSEITTQSDKLDLPRSVWADQRAT